MSKRKWAERRPPAVSADDHPATPPEESEIADEDDEGSILESPTKKRRQAKERSSPKKPGSRRGGRKKTQEPEAGPHQTDVNIQHTGEWKGEWHVLYLREVYRSPEDGRFHYYVKWVGWEDKDEWRWQRHASLENCAEMLESFWTDVKVRDKCPIMDDSEYKKTIQLGVSKCPSKEWIVKTKEAQLKLVDADNPVPDWPDPRGVSPGPFEDPMPTVNLNQELWKVGQEYCDKMGKEGEEYGSSDEDDEDNAGVAPDMDDGDDEYVPPIDEPPASPIPLEAFMYSDPEESVHDDSDGDSDTTNSSYTVGGTPEYLTPFTPSPQRLQGSALVPTLPAAKRRFPAITPSLVLHEHLHTPWALAAQTRASAKKPKAHSFVNEVATGSSSGFLKPPKTVNAVVEVKSDLDFVVEEAISGSQPSYEDNGFDLADLESSLLSASQDAKVVEKEIEPFDDPFIERQDTPTMAAVSNNTGSPTPKAIAPALSRSMLSTGLPPRPWTSRASIPAQQKTSTWSTVAALNSNVETPDRLPVARQPHSALGGKKNSANGQEPRARRVRFALDGETAQPENGGIEGAGLPPNPVASTPASWKVPAWLASTNDTSNGWGTEGRSASAWQTNASSGWGCSNNAWSAWDAKEPNTTPAVGWGELPTPSLPPAHNGTPSLSEHHSVIGTENTAVNSEADSLTAAGRAQRQTGAKSTSGGGWGEATKTASTWASSGWESNAGAWDAWDAETAGKESVSTRVAAWSSPLALFPPPALDTSPVPTGRRDESSAGHRVDKSDGTRHDWNTSHSEQVSEDRERPSQNQPRYSDGGWTSFKDQRGRSLPQQKEALRTQVAHRTRDEDGAEASMHGDSLASPPARNETGGDGGSADCLDEKIQPFEVSTAFDGDDEDEEDAEVEKIIEADSARLSRAMSKMKVIDLTGSDEEMEVEDGEIQE